MNSHSLNFYGKQNQTKETMQTTVRDMIKAELLRVCGEVTTRLREKDEKKEKKRKFTREQHADIEAKMKSAGWSGDNLPKMLEIFGILHDAPELKAGIMIPRELFAVVVLEANPAGRHAYGLNLPFILCNAKGNYLFHTDGSTANWVFQVDDKPRFATDAEVESCINSLNDNQWKVIMAHELFRPIIDAVMNKTVNVEDHTGNGRAADGEDVVLQDGRTIVA